MSDQNNTLPPNIKQEPSASGKSDVKSIKDYKNYVSSGIYPTGGRAMAASGDRLPSLRAPRDLTLGAGIPKPGSSRQKKIFTPNVMQKRVKMENVEDNSKSNKAQKGRYDKSKGKHEKGRGRFQKEYIQMAGTLFAEGANRPNPRKMGGYGGGGGFGGSGGGGGGGRGAENMLQKPVINPHVLKDIDDELEQKKLKELLRDDFIDYEGLHPCMEDRDLPLQLPLQDSGIIFKHEDDTIKYKPNKPMRIEDSDDDDVDRMKTSQTAAPPREDKLDKSLPELLGKEHNDLILFQLPSSLPSLPAEAIVKQESTVESVDKSLSQKMRMCSTMDDLPEGQVGVIKIHKSGKAVLWLGNHSLVINKGTQIGFLQDAASVDIDEEGKSGSLSVVGHVKHRLVFNPNFDDMLAKS